MGCTCCVLVVFVVQSNYITLCTVGSDQKIWEFLWISKAGFFQERYLILPLFFARVSLLSMFFCLFSVRLHQLIPTASSSELLNRSWVLEGARIMFSPLKLSGLVFGSKRQTFVAEVFLSWVSSFHAFQMHLSSSDLPSLSGKTKNKYHYII